MASLSLPRQLQNMKYESSPRKKLFRKLSFSSRSNMLKVSRSEVGSTLNSIDPGETAELRRRPLGPPSPVVLPLRARGVDISDLFKSSEVGTVVNLQRHRRWTPIYRTYYGTIEIHTDIQLYSRYSCIDCPSPALRSATIHCSIHPRSDRHFSILE